MKIGKVPSRKACHTLGGPRLSESWVAGSRDIEHQALELCRGWLALDTRTYGSVGFYTTAMPLNALGVLWTAHVITNYFPPPILCIAALQSRGKKRATVKLSSK